MARVKSIFKISDHPMAAEPATGEALQELFDHLFPGGPVGEPHAGYAILAQSPKLALNIAKMSDCILGDVGWTRRRDLRELSVQALNLHYKCDFSFHAHLSLAELSGITLEQQAALPYWQTSALFNEEQKLVIEYTLACISGEVDEELFAKVVDHYGEQGAIEFTVTVGWWSLWAMLLNATRPEFNPDQAQPLPKDANEKERYQGQGSADP